jgi:hypothetical protein
MERGASLTLTIELSPELQRRLAEEAARRGLRAEEFAREVLEERLAAHPADPAAAFLESLPRPSPEEVQSLLRAEGAQRVERFEELMGAGPEHDGDEEFDVDEFLRERRKWQWEGAPAFSNPKERPRSTREEP